MKKKVDVKNYVGKAIAYVNKGRVVYFLELLE